MKKQWEDWAKKKVEVELEQWIVEERKEKVVVSDKGI